MLRVNELLDGFDKFCVVFSEQLPELVEDELFLLLVAEEKESHPLLDWLQEDVFEPYLFDVNYGVMNHQFI